MTDPNAAREPLCDGVANLMRSFTAACIARNCQPAECPGICLARHSIIAVALAAARAEGWLAMREEAAKRVSRIVCELDWDEGYHDGFAAACRYAEADIRNLHDTPHVEEP